MFSTADIERASRIVKVATALGAPSKPMAGPGYMHNALPMPSRPAHGMTAEAPTTASSTPPVGSVLDPYAYNSEAFWNPNVQNHGWNPPERPGFLGSLGKSTVGKMMSWPVNLARSYVGLAPGRSGFRNMLSGAPQVLGGHIFNDPEMIAAGHAHSQPNGPGGYWNPFNWQNEESWAAPAMNAEAQSKEYLSALPQYLQREHPFFADPKEFVHQKLKNTFDSKYPWPGWNAQ